MISTASSIGVRVLCFMVMLVATAALGWWWQTAPQWRTASAVGPQSDVVWHTPDDFLPDDKATTVSASASAPANTEPPMAASAPSVKVTRVNVKTGVPPQQLGLLTPGLAPLESRVVIAQPDLDVFDQNIQRRLQELWAAPSANEVPSGSDRVVMKFTISRDGSVVFSDEDRLSGNQAMDRSVRYVAALFIHAGQPVPQSHLRALYDVSVEFCLR